MMKRSSLEEEASQATQRTSVEAALEEGTTSAV